MKILFLGDSITQGQGASCPQNNYVNLVGKDLDCEVVNYGLGGTRIARQTYVNYSTTFNYDFRLRAQIMQRDADMLFVFGGVNDFKRGRLVLGSAQERSGNTFCNELRLLIEDLSEKYGKEKLCFILPLHCFDEEGVCCKGENGDEMGASLSGYVEAIREVVQEYGIDVIDLYNNGIPKPLVNTGDEYTVEGIHPNDKGHRLIADRICEYVRKKNSKA